MGPKGVGRLVGVADAVAAPRFCFWAILPSLSPQRGLELYPGFFFFFDKLSVFGTSVGSFSGYGVNG